MEGKVSENNWRHERKFALTPIEFLEFEKQLMLSDLDLLYPDRRINNCYLDDVNHNSYQESTEGFSEKMKVRIRWYGNLFSTTTPRLEFKIKQNNSNRKELFTLEKVNFHKSFNWSVYIHEVKKHLFNKHKFYLEEKFLPVLINSYKRSYYSNYRKSFRLTVDNEMRFMSPNNRLASWNGHTIEKYVVELKFNNSQVITDFPLLSNLGKFSKFNTGVLLNQ